MQQGACRRKNHTISETYEEMDNSPVSENVTERRRITDGQCSGWTNIREIHQDKFFTAGSKVVVLEILKNARAKSLIVRWRAGNLASRGGEW
jgi:hypothetical protein